MSKRKVQLVHLHMPVILYDMIARESYQTSTSKQEIVRQIVRAHYSKKYGISWYESKLGFIKNYGTEYYLE